LVAGWNSGYSSKAGGGKVVSYLEETGLEVTHKNVFEYSRKSAWHKGVL